MSPTDGRDELRGRFTRWIVITAEHAQKNYLRAEKKQLQTVPLEEADVAIVDTALLSAGVTPDSFDFEEQRFSRLPQPALTTNAVSVRLKVKQDAALQRLPIPFPAAGRAQFLSILLFSFCRGKTHPAL